VGERVLPANQDTDDGPHWEPPDEAATRSDERQRIARELHDSTSQLVVVLQLQVSRLNELASPEAAPLIQERKATIQEIHAQIRGLNGN
jgi:signal transduction histidine kinase